MNNIKIVCGSAIKITEKDPQMLKLAWEDLINDVNFTSLRNISIEVEIDLIKTIEEIKLKSLKRYKALKNLDYCKIFISGQWFKESEAIFWSWIEKLKYAKKVDIAMFHQGFKYIISSLPSINEISKLYLRKLSIIKLKLSPLYQNYINEFIEKLSGIKTLEEFDYSYEFSSMALPLSKLSPKVKLNNKTKFPSKISLSKLLNVKYCLLDNTN